MRYDLKICLAVAFLFAMVLCSCRAVPVRIQAEADNALERIMQRLMTRLPQNIIPEEGYERDIRDIDVLERRKRGRSPLRGVALVPIDSLRRQYEEERRRRKQQEQDAQNQKFFDRIG
ncbi:hypothetical protein HOLleu_40567 [Holothuria leucospilota]|uniref:Uncharacterized protein n=1 Tax=Holothuria leucospilota TaxID=206669 RepID=A0A9Q0YHW2_HOLLE|nr:hypothetical protein HOLleu_40567 [Holothuria leucospilota]